MKLSATLATLALIGSGCGYNNAYKDIHDLQRQMQEQQERDEQLQGELDKQAAALQGLAATLNQQGDYLEGAIANLEQQLAIAQQDTAELQLELDGQQAALNNVEQDLASVVAQLAVVQGYTHVASIIDPCGNHPTKYDELLLKLADGRILASFSDAASGLNTRLAEVPAGTYKTTDGTDCVFTVNSSGAVAW